MRVFLTFDVEVWCDDWHDLARGFPDAYARCVYGGSKRAGHALPRTLETLDRHGLRGVFLVEPLFAARFGIEYLAEIVALILAAGQEVQMHMHPAWADEARPPLLPGATRKRGHMSAYSLAEQTELVRIGSRLLQQAGAPAPVAFRAGSFAANRDTLRALKANGLRYDLSANAVFARSLPDLREDIDMHAAAPVEGLWLLPLSVFRDGFGRLRHAQVGACATSELIRAMEDARHLGRGEFILLSHNFEMLKPGRRRPDAIVARRFEALCRHLAVHAGDMKTCGFADLPPAAPGARVPRLPRVGALPTLRRYGEQALRRLV